MHELLLSLGAFQGCVLFFNGRGLLSGLLLPPGADRGCHSNGLISIYLDVCLIDELIVWTSQ